MARQGGRRFRHDGPGQVAVGRRVIAHRGDRLGDLFHVVGHVLGALAVSLCHADQNALEGRQPVPVLRRKIGAAEKRSAAGGEKHRQRPAAAPGKSLDRVHIDLVEVGTLLAIDLDRHEQLVHHPRGFRVLERFPLHHVAPMAGRVADRQQDRLVFGLGARQRLLTPRIPVHGIVRVLAQIRALLIDETIGLAVVSARIRDCSSMPLWRDFQAGPVLRLDRVWFPS